MIDFTHTKRPEFVQLVLIIAAVCLALGAISPAASAAAYDWDYSVSFQKQIDLSSISWSLYYQPVPEYMEYTASTDLLDIWDASTYYREAWCYYPLPSVGTTSEYYMDYYYNPETDFVTRPVVPHVMSFEQPRMIARYWGWESLYSSNDIAFEAVARDLYNTYGVERASFSFGENYEGRVYLLIFISDPDYFFYGKDSVLVSASAPFSVDVVDSGTDYLISVSGFDGTSIEGSAYYTISVSTYSGGYDLHLSSFPMYLGDSPVHFWPSDETFTLPVYLSDGVTPIDYYCILSFMGDPTLQGYPFWWNLASSGSLEYPFNTNYPPVVPTPGTYPDIIPDPDDVNDTVNFTGWYQYQGYESNSITAPIYSGMRGWFSVNMIPLFDFYLVPIGSLASMISESAGTSTDAISDSVEQLSIYAAPMNLVGGYVVLLVPDVVWVVVFAALSIGYVVLLIRISTGSIKNTISRFLGRW